MEKTLDRRCHPIRMRQKAYVDQGGTVCPVCIGPYAAKVGRFWQDETGTVRCKMICEDCGARWTEVYKLQGYEEG